MAPLLSLVKQVEEPNATGKKDEGRQATEPHAPVQSTGMGLDNLTVANTLQFVATFDPSENRKWEGQENEDGPFRRGETTDDCSHRETDTDNGDE